MPQQHAKHGLKFALLCVLFSMEIIQKDVHGFSVSHLHLSEHKSRLAKQYKENLHQLKVLLLELFVLPYYNYSHIKIIESEVELPICFTVEA